jgi:hypothetical protein
MRKHDVAGMREMRVELQPRQRTTQQADSCFAGHETLLGHRILVVELEVTQLRLRFFTGVNPPELTGLLAGRQRRHALGIGRVLINAQIAAGYGFTLRLRHGDAFLRHAYLQKNCPHCYPRSGA